MSSRIDSIEAPRGAGRIPLIVILVVAALVVAALLAGTVQRGWLLVVLVPTGVFSLYLCARVVGKMLHAPEDIEQE